METWDLAKCTRTVLGWWREPLNVNLHSTVKLVKFQGIDISLLSGKNQFGKELFKFLFITNAVCIAGRCGNSFR